MSLIKNLISHTPLNRFEHFSIKIHCGDFDQYVGKELSGCFSHVKGNETQKM